MNEQTGDRKGCITPGSEGYVPVSGLEAVDWNDPLGCHMTCGRVNHSKANKCQIMERDLMFREEFVPMCCPLFELWKREREREKEQR